MSSFDEYSYIEDTLRGYNEGFVPVEDVLQVSRSYEGPAPHFLWCCDGSLRYDGPVIAFCFGRFSEEKVFELLRVLIEDDPAAPAILWEG